MTVFFSLFNTSCHFTWDKMCWYFFLPNHFPATAKWSTVISISAIILLRFLFWFWCEHSFHTWKIRCLSLSRWRNFYVKIRIFMSLFLKYRYCAWVFHIETQWKKKRKYFDWPFRRVFSFSHIKQFLYRFINNKYKNLWFYGLKHNMLIWHTIVIQKGKWNSSLLLAFSWFFTLNISHRYFKKIRFYLIAIRHFSHLFHRLNSNMNSTSRVNFFNYKNCSANSPF